MAASHHAKDERAQPMNTDLSFDNLADLKAYFARVVSPEEVESRNRVAQNIVALRERIGPIGMTLEELLPEDDDD